MVMRVGESGKRGASFVNGQFGFGMQAFRAACATLTVRSRGVDEDKICAMVKTIMDEEREKAYEANKEASSHEVVQSHLEAVL